MREFDAAASGVPAAAAAGGAVRSPEEVRAEDVAREAAQAVARAVGDGLATAGWLSRAASRRVSGLARELPDCAPPAAAAAEAAAAESGAGGAKRGGGGRESEGGGGGFLEGLGKSLLGGVGGGLLRPSAGLLDLAARASDRLSGAAAGAASAPAPPAEFGGRVRPPRVRGRDGMLRCFDAGAARGHDVVRRVCGGKYADEMLVGCGARPRTSGARRRALRRKALVAPVGTSLERGAMPAPLFRRG